MPDIELCGQLFPVNEVKKAPGKYAKLLDSDKNGRGYARCMCRQDKILKINIRKSGETFILARWPGEGPEHAVDKCDFHETDAGLTGASGYKKDAILREEGVFDIKGDFSLSLATGVTEFADTPSSSGSNRKRRGAVGLLGLLHTLWETAKLNYWHPKWTRDWSRVHYGLNSLLVGKLNGKDLSSYAYVVPPFRKDRAAGNEAKLAKFKSLLGDLDRVTHRGIIIFEVKQIDPTDKGFQLTMCHEGKCKIFGSRTLLDKMGNSYPSEFAALKKGEGHVVGIALVEKNPKGFIVAKQLSLMLTGGKYIPADSLYECQMAARLLEAGRTFFKPLRYDGQSDFPDFVLTDVQPNAYIEVFGMASDPEYAERMAEKRASYAEKGIPLIEWVPPGPPPDVSHQT